MKTPKKSRRIYLIEIMPNWHLLVAPDLPDGKQCFYVGETGKDLTERYWEHHPGLAKKGRRKKRTAVFTKMRNSQDGDELLKNHDVKLRRTRSKKYPVVATTKESVPLEAQVIDQLRRRGHAFNPEKPGEIDFKSYKTAA